MALFKYTAMDASNAVTKGILEEPDKASAAQKLMIQGLRPLELKPYSGESSKKITLPDFMQFKRKKISRMEIDFFTKQIAMLLNAGLSLDGALRVMKNNSQEEIFREFCGSLERKLKEGKSFSEALADYPHFSPDVHKYSQSRRGGWHSSCHAESYF